MNDLELDFLKKIIKADMTKNELSVLYMLLNNKDKLLFLSSKELAKLAGLAQPNYQRCLKSLSDKNVIGRRSNRQIFVRSTNVWGKKSKPVE